MMQLTGATVISTCTFICIIMAIRPVQPGFRSLSGSDFGFTFGELRFAPVRICFDVVTDYAEQGGAGIHKGVQESLREFN